MTSAHGPQSSARAPLGLLGLFVLLAVCLLLPSAAFAQDDDEMSFGVEEAQEAEEEAEMTFDTADEAQQAAVAGSDKLAVVAVPSEQLTRDERIQLQQQMEANMAMAPDYMVMGGDAVLQGLEQAGMDTCVKEPLCLSGVGQDAGVNRILMARVKRMPDGLQLDMDLFDVDEKLFVKYKSVTGLETFADVLNAVDPAMREIFDVRVERQDPNYVDEEDTGAVQTYLAYGTAGLAVISLGAGIYFGMEASSGEDDLNAEQNGDGTYNITQVEAQARLQEVEDNALTANIFYGLAGAFAITSGILFYIDAGSDVASEEELRGDVDWRLAPTVGTDGVGFGAAGSF